jgi:hypothetical protein
MKIYALLFILLLLSMAAICPLFGEDENEHSTFTARAERIEGGKSRLILTEHLPTGETLEMPIDIIFQTRALAARRVEDTLFVVLQVDEFFIERAVYELRKDAWERVSAIRLCGMRSLLIDRVVAASISNDGNTVTISTLPMSEPIPQLDGVPWQNRVLKPRKNIDPEQLLTDTFVISGEEVEWHRAPDSILPGSPRAGGDRK